MGIKWISKHSLITIEAENLLIWFESDRPVHLYVIYSFYKPSTRHRIDIIRGVPTPCGLQYVYSDTTCIEQDEQGDSTEHHWYIPLEDIRGTIYFFIASTCTYIAGAQTTPPMTIHISAPDPWLVLQNADYHIIEDFTTWATDTAGDGYIAQDFSYLSPFSGPTPHGRAIAYQPIYTSSWGELKLHDLDWSRKLELTWFAYLNTEDIGGDRFAWLRLSQYDPAPQLSHPGVQFLFKREFGQIIAQSHDGVNLEETIISEWEQFNVRAPLQINHDPLTGTRFQISGLPVAFHQLHYPHNYAADGFVLQVGANNGSTTLSMNIPLFRVMLKTQFPWWPPPP